MPNDWLPKLLSHRLLTRRLALAAPAALVASCAAHSRSADAHHSPSQMNHIVAFKYRPTVTQQQKEEIAQRFLALRKECSRDDRNYIVDIIGGDCTGSIEGLTAGFEQVFIVTFENRTDYLYYIGKPFSSTFDPAHDAFKKFVAPLLRSDPDEKINGALVLDFR